VSESGPSPHRRFVHDAGANAVGGLILLVVVTVAGRLAGVLDEPLFWTSTVAAGLLAVATVGWVLAVRRQREVAEARTAPVPPEDEAAVRIEAPAGLRSVGGRWLVGIDIGRSRLSVGVMEVLTDDLHRLPAVMRHDEANVPEPDQRPSHFASLEIYDDLVNAVVHVSRSHPRIDGIGLGVPGQIDPVRGFVVDSPAAFAPNDPIAEKLAARLAERDDICARLGIGNVANRDQRRQMLRTRILVDNDVRCATRAVLSARGGDPGWRNFACVFIGTGVGSGLVIDGELYYGSAYSAGEVGHMTIHLARRQTEPRLPGEGLIADPGECACGRQGVHWESLVNGPGLERLARELSPELATRLAEAAGSPHGRLAAEDVGNAIRDVDRGAIHDEDLKQYVIAVSDSYARYLAVGLANIANSLNLEHITLGGGVMDGLFTSPTFRAHVGRHLRRYCLESTFRAPILDEGARPGWAWQGSALLFRDPGYADLLNRAA
jgi:glucokinase